MDDVDRTEQAAGTTVARGAVRTFAVGFAVLGVLAHLEAEGQRPTGEVLVGGMFDRWGGARVRVADRA